MYQTFALNFVCRPCKVRKNGFAPVEVCITVNKQRTFISLPRIEVPENFKSAMKSRRTNETKAFCDSIRGRLQSVIAQLSTASVQITASAIKDAYINGFSAAYTVEKLFNDYLKIIELKNMPLYNYTKYQRTRDIFFSLIDKTKEASKITNDDILIYKAQIESIYKNGTISGYMTKLKSFINYGLNNGKITVNPFASIKIKKHKAKVEIISDDEYEAMRDKEITIERVAKIRDFLILQCNCGLAFSDMKKLKKYDFKVVDGYVTIDKERTKTHVDFYSVVLPDGVKILEKYDYDISQIMISNVKTNAYAKEVQDICGVTSVSSLHTHLCRHFYITKLLRMGIDPHIVQKCAGHSRIQQTMEYAHLVDNDVLNAFNRVVK